jgi:hypothetical protein
MGANVSSISHDFDNILDHNTNMHCNSSSICTNIIEDVTAGSIDQRGFAGSKCGVDLMLSSANELIESQSTEMAASWIPGANVDMSKTELKNTLKDYVDSNCMSDTAIKNVIRNAHIEGHINQYCDVKANCTAHLITHHLQKYESENESKMEGSGIFGSGSGTFMKYLMIGVVSLSVISLIGGGVYLAFGEKDKKRKFIPDDVDILL